MSSSELHSRGSFPRVSWKSQDVTLKFETSREILRPTAGLNMTDDWERLQCVYFAALNVVASDMKHAHSRMRARID